MSNLEDVEGSLAGAGIAKTGLDPKLQAVLQDAAQNAIHIFGVLARNPRNGVNAKSADDMLEVLTQVGQHATVAEIEIARQRMIGKKLDGMQSQRDALENELDAMWALAKDAAIKMAIVGAGLIA